MIKIREFHKASPWPPEDFQEVYEKYEEHSAWYSGCPLRLADYYAGRVYSPTVPGSFWARQVNSEVSTRLRVPVASDLAALSSDLLFSKPLITTCENQGAQKRLEEIKSLGDVNSVLLEAGEFCAALGGVFLKVNWDSTVADYPILSVVQPDNALSYFKFGKLVSAIFFKTVLTEDTLHFRLLEEHVKGYIYYSLYRGTEDKIGQKISIKSLPETAELEEVLPTGLNKLACCYIPNMKPNRLFRGYELGQSDFAGVEGLMDALDSVYTSWLRDVELAKSRIIVPETWVDTDGAFDSQREVFTTLDIDPVNADNLGVTMNQFEIRAQSHRDTALELLDRIITHAGYSPQTFGLKIEGRAESGTALNIRERKTFTTRSKKTGYWKTGLEDMFYVLLAIDNTKLGGRTEAERPNVEFQNPYLNIEETASTISALKSAEAASTETRVRLLHPDWKESQIQKEVQAIQSERGL